MNSDVLRKKQSPSKLLALFVVVAMLSIGIVAVTNSSDSSDAAVSNVIWIDDADELRLIGNNSGYPLNGNYKLKNNIEFAGSAPFTPIGTPTDPFTGTFQGNCKSIRNIYVFTDDVNAALFGYVSGNATISDVTMIGGSITTTTVRYPASESIAGGIIGEIFGQGNVKVTDCVNKSTSVTSTTYTAGGIVGMIREPTGKFSVTITDCTNNAPVSAFNLAGGIVGKNYGGIVKVTKCSNTGPITNVTGTEFFNFKTSLGGIVGWSGSYIDIVRCSNSGSVTAVEAVGYGYVGGIAGICYGKISGCTNQGAVSVTAAIPDPAHEEQARVLMPIDRDYDYTEDPLFDDPTVYSPVYKVRAGGIVGYMGAGCIDDCWVCGASNRGKITATGLDARAGGIVGYTMIAVNGFRNDGDVNAFGLVSDESFTYAGGIAGFANSNIKSATNYGKVVASKGANNRAGGIVGYQVASTTVSCSYSGGDVTANGEAVQGHSYAGGIAGVTYGKITLCYNDDNRCSSTVVTANGYYARAGGIAGIVEPSGKITLCANRATVVANSAGFESTAGGIAGFMVNGSSVEDCLNGSNVTAKSTGIARSVAGGIVGKSEENTKVCNCSNVAKCSNNRVSAVSERASLAGGIAGIANGSVTKCDTVGQKGFCCIPSYNVSVTSHAPTAYAGGIAAMTGASSYIYNNKVEYCKINCEYSIECFCSEIVGNPEPGTQTGKNTFKSVTVSVSRY